MYYRWTEKATIVPPENRGKWIRTTFHKLLVKYPQYLIWVKSGHMEIKDESSTEKQIAQRKMWQLQGRMVALMAQEQLLARELSYHFPQHFKNMGTSSVIQEFYADVSNIDLGLLLKKYYPHLYKSTTPP